MIKISGFSLTIFGENIMPTTSYQKNGTYKKHSWFIGDVAVIDEIQMIADPERGWAWTRAFLGACAKTVYVCGESSAIPLIKDMALACGDSLQVFILQFLWLNAPTSFLALQSLPHTGSLVVEHSVLGLISGLVLTKYFNWKFKFFCLTLKK